MSQGAEEQGGVSRKRPTDKQRWVLGVLEAGGHIERPSHQLGATLVPIDGRQCTLQQSTYLAMQERGWLWMAAPDVWRITTAGRAATGEVCEGVE
jgi:hypothetical protein